MPEFASAGTLSSFLAEPRQSRDGEDGTIKHALKVIRTHLGMEVAYVSEIVGDRSVFREVDAPGQEQRIKAGDTHSLDDVYCRHILEGRLPQLIPDTADQPIAMAMPITKALPIGSHMSVPIRLPDGQVYGMFCCLSFDADRSLNERDMQMMRAFADLAAFEINRDLIANNAIREKTDRVQSMIDDDRFSIVYQPIWNLETGNPVGVECLTRFSAEPVRTPEKWFAEAAESGLGVALELATMQRALAAISSFPDSVHLAINASPQTILSRGFREILDGLPSERLVLEITEHAHIDDYEQLTAALQPLRDLGVRIAVDDAGAGYSCLQHILHLRPDLIKLDMSLTRHINIDSARRALTTALISFAHKTNSRIVAEGVETASELETLKALGVEKAQGFFLARPMALEGAVALFHGSADEGKRVSAR